MSTRTVENLAEKIPSLLDKVLECPVCHSKSQINIKHAQYWKDDGTFSSDEFFVSCDCRYGKKGPCTYAQAKMVCGHRYNWTSTLDAAIKSWNKRVKALIADEELYEIESTLKRATMNDAFGTPVHVSDIVAFACPLGNRGYDLAKAVVRSISSTGATAVLFNPDEADFCAIHPNITQRKIAKLATI